MNFEMYSTEKQIRSELDERVKKNLNEYISKVQAIIRVLFSVYFIAMAFATAQVIVSMYKALIEGPINVWAERMTIWIILMTIVTAVKLPIMKGLSRHYDYMRLAEQNVNMIDNYIENIMSLKLMRLAGCKDVITKFEDIKKEANDLETAVEIRKIRILDITVNKEYMACTVTGERKGKERVFEFSLVGIKDGGIERDKYSIRLERRGFVAYR